MKPIYRFFSAFSYAFLLGISLFVFLVSVVCKGEEENKEITVVVNIQESLNVNILDETKKVELVLKKGSANEICSSFYVDALSMFKMGFSSYYGEFVSEDGRGGIPYTITFEIRNGVSLTETYISTDLLPHHTAFFKKGESFYPGQYMVTAIIKVFPTWKETAGEYCEIYTLHCENL